MCPDVCCWTGWRRRVVMLNNKPAYNASKVSFGLKNFKKRNKNKKERHTKKKNLWNLERGVDTVHKHFFMHLTHILSHSVYKHQTQGVVSNAQALRKHCEIFVSLAPQMKCCSIFVVFLLTVGLITWSTVNSKSHAVQRSSFDYHDNKLKCIEELSR